MPAASLGHYASLSFVVIGIRRNWGIEELRNFRFEIAECRLIKGTKTLNFLLALCALCLEPYASLATGFFSFYCRLKISED